MKRKNVLFIALVSLVFLTVLSSGVSAQINLDSGGEQIVGYVEDFFAPFARSLFGASEYLFERILFLTILITLIYQILDRVPVFKDKPGPTWVTTIAVSVLATRFLGEAQVVETILLPYTVLGVALTAAIPTLIYFAFVQSFDASSATRKTLWIFYLIIFIGIWISRSEELGGLAWIYFITALASLIFLLADGTIRKIIHKQEIKERTHEMKLKRIDEIQKQIAELDELKDKINMKESRYKYLRKNLDSRLKAAMKI